MHTEAANVIGLVEWKEKRAHEREAHENARQQQEELAEISSLLEASRAMLRAINGHVSQGDHHFDELAAHVNVGVMRQELRHLIDDLTMAKLRIRRKIKQS
jgi:hypothetical protein